MTIIARVAQLSRDLKEVGILPEDMIFYANWSKNYTYKEFQEDYVQINLKNLSTKLYSPLGLEGRKTIGKFLCDEFSDNNIEVKFIGSTSFGIFIKKETD